jgi:hypothetical protein
MRRQHADEKPSAAAAITEDHATATPRPALQGSAAVARRSDNLLDKCREIDGALAGRLP